MSLAHSSQVCPGWPLDLPLSQAEHNVAPGVLDLPMVQLVQNALGGSLPIVPAGHVVKPDGADALILDPFGTIKEAEPPLITIEPRLTLMQLDCSGSGWKYAEGQSMHLTLAWVLENLPGEQGIQETEPVLLVYVPFEQGARDALAPSQV